ncbi:MAG: class I SAM-dependent methyltransferase [Myxococcota bacterium]
MILRDLHGRFVHGPRVHVLAGHLGEAIPRGASVLDVGCGDGALASELLALRPDLEIHGIDVVVRDDTAIPVEPFDGSRIPAPEGSYDVILFVDVLHHTEDPRVLLREARRVCRGCIVIKDHNRNGFLAGPTLRFMDWVGNRPDQIALPYNYWPRERWRRAFRELRLEVVSWNEKLSLFRPPGDWVFGRSLHFVARLVPE